MRKTSQTFWNDIWTAQPTIQLLDPTSGAVTRAFDRALYRTVEAALRDWGEIPTNVIELGCGGSPYLPFFARQFGLTVAGLDYSPSGCDLARRVLTAAGVSGDIRQGDMFDPPSAFQGHFDIVFSMGLLEHFTDTATAIAAAKRFLRPGGLMLSVIPNMTRLPGWLQRHLHPVLYDVHVPLDQEALAAAHAEAGLEVLDSSYLMTLNLYVLQYRNERSLVGFALRGFRAAFMRLLWWIERTAGRSWPSATFSPYVLCVARVR